MKKYKKERRIVCYVEGLLHTNTIESFWAGVKRAWLGQHHYHGKKHTGLYITEIYFKHNTKDSSFPNFIRNIVAV